MKDPALTLRADVSAVLTSPVKLAVLVRIARSGGPVTVAGLAADLGVSRDALYRHMHQLREAGWVHVERWVREASRRGAMEAEWVLTPAGIAAQWDATLDALNGLPLPRSGSTPTLVLPPPGE